eukprot:1072728-Rhodomonas_salina.1
MVWRYQRGKDVSAVLQRVGVGAGMQVVGRALQSGASDTFGGHTKCAWCDGVQGCCGVLSFRIQGTDQFTVFVVALPPSSLRSPSVLTQFT